jgi:uncharacterized membrane protein
MTIPYAINAAVTYVLWIVAGLGLVVLGLIFVWLIIKTIKGIISTLKDED